MQRINISQPLILYSRTLLLLLLLFSLGCARACLCPRVSLAGAPCCMCVCVCVVRERAGRTKQQLLAGYAKLCESHTEISIISCAQAKIGRTDKRRRHRRFCHERERGALSPRIYIQCLFNSDAIIWSHCAAAAVANVSLQPRAKGYIYLIYVYIWLCPY